MRTRASIFLLLVVLSIGSILGQDKRFTFGLRTELLDRDTHNEGYDYGFNLGAKIEYQMWLLFFNAEVYYVPNLNGIDYTHFQGTTLGFNTETMNGWRFYTGVIKPGFIIREGSPYAMFGVDVGVEKYFNNNTFTGIKIGYDTKADSKLWGEDKPHNVWYFSVIFGIYWE